MEPILLNRVVPALGMILVASLIELLVPLREQARGKGGRLNTNLYLIAITLLLGAILNSALATGSIFFEQRGIGLLPSLDIDGLTAALLSILLLDLSAYLAHVFMHKVSWAWKIHLVHHIDEAVDATTAFRQHPLEGMLRFAFTACAAWSLGVQVEVIALYRLLSAGNAVLEHANIRVPVWLDRSLVWFWVTPDMHKVHHSCNQQETDTNYANLFSLFDRLFQTFIPTYKAASVRYGIQGFEHPDCQSIRAVSLMPFSR